MWDPSRPSFVGRVETPDEDNKITLQSVPAIENVLMASVGFEPGTIISSGTIS